MLKPADFKRFLLDWRPCGAGVAWLLALVWWLVLSWPLRRNLRAALGGAAGRPTPGPPTRPRRPKRRLAGAAVSREYLPEQVRRNDARTISL